MDFGNDSEGASVKHLFHREISKDYFEDGGNLNDIEMLPQMLEIAGVISPFLLTRVQSDLPMYVPKMQRISKFGAEEFWITAIIRRKSCLK